MVHRLRQKGEHIGQWFDMDSSLQSGWHVKNEAFTDIPDRFTWSSFLLTEREGRERGGERGEDKERESER